MKKVGQKRTSKITTTEIESLGREKNGVKYYSEAERQTIAQYTRSKEKRKRKQAISEAYLNELGPRLLAARNRARLSRKTLGEGYMEEHTVRNIENCQSMPSAYVIKLYAERCNVSASSLLLGENENVNRVESEILIKFRKLSPAKKKMLQAYLDFLVNYKE